jgi:hypothetical protein
MHLSEKILSTTVRSISRGCDAQARGNREIAKDCFALLRQECGEHL